VGDITRILERARNSDPGAADELLPIVYHELRRLAVAKMAQERPGQTLQPTALVHEAWLRLCGDQPPEWQNRVHFAAASEAWGRAVETPGQSRLKRGWGSEFLPIVDQELNIPMTAPAEEILAVNEALDRLALEDPRPRSSEASLFRRPAYAGGRRRDASVFANCEPVLGRRASALEGNNPRGTRLGGPRNRAASENNFGELAQFARRWRMCRVKMISLDNGDPLPDKGPGLRHLEI
jgi:hypothetical protein